MATVLAFFTSLGILFQSSTVLFEKISFSPPIWPPGASDWADLPHSWLVVQLRLPFGTRPRFNVIASFVEIQGFCYEFHAFSSAAVPGTSVWVFKNGTNISYSTLIAWQLTVHILEEWIGVMYTEINMALTTSWDRLRTYPVPTNEYRYRNKQLQSLRKRLK